MRRAGRWRCAARNRPPAKQGPREAFAFDGATAVEVSKPDDFDLTHQDFTLLARIKTDGGGTIFSKTHPGERWVRDAKPPFVGDGRLCFDIGWGWGPCGLGRRSTTEPGTRSP